MMGWGARRAAQSGAVAARAGDCLEARPQSRGWAVAFVSSTVSWPADGCLAARPRMGCAGVGEIESAVGVDSKKGAAAYFNSLPFFCKSFMQRR